MAGQIIPKGERKWLVRVFLGRDSKTGRKKYFSKQINGNKKDAQSYLNGVLREIDLGTFVPPSPTTVNEYLDRWLATAAKPRLRERTYTDYEYLLTQYVRPALGHFKLSSVRPLDIQTLYSDLQERGLSARTVRYVHAVLSSALKQAVKWRLAAQNPASFVDLPRQARKEMQALSPDAAAQFLAAAAEDRYGALFTLALSTGLRPEEYLALQWKDVDLHKGVLTVQRTLVWKRKGGGWYFSVPKTSKSRRSIPLSASIIRALSDHRRKQAEERLKLGPNYQSLDLVFANTEGGPLILRNLLKRHYKPILKQAGLPESLRLYDLRHSCATLLLAANENPKVVSERLGHSSITLTLDTYSHVLPTMQQAASDKLENMLFSKVDTPVTYQNEKGNLAAARK